MPNPVKTVRGVKLLLKKGNGADPEVFAQLCSINTQRGITFTAGVNEQDVIDCDDPDAVAWVAREKTNLSCSIDGAGTLDTRDLQAFADWFESPTSSNCELIVDVPGADGGITFTGAFHLTNFKVDGTRGQRASVTVSIVSDGIVTNAPNA